MKISKHKNGWYYAHIKGSTPINLQVRNAEDARKVATEARLSDIELAHIAKSLTKETVTRLMSGGKTTGAEALAAWEKHVALVGRARSTVHRYRIDIKGFLDEHKLWDSVLSGVTDEMVMAFVNPASSIKRTTRVNRLAALQSFFTVCSRFGYTAGNPAELAEVRMDTMSFEQKEPKARQPFTQLQLDRMMVALPASFFRPAAFIASEYGLRLGDVACLEWNQFDFEKNRFVVWTDKHDRRIEFEITPELRRVIGAIPRRDDVHVFPREAAIAMDPTARSMLSTYFARELRRLGIEGRTFHSLRHTFATRHAQLGTSVDAIRQKLGHVRSDTTLGYIHDGTK